jgi:hypothetical protein
MEITPLHSFILEKPPVAQLVKNSPTFYGTQRFITLFPTALSAGPCPKPDKSSPYCLILLPYVPF